MKKLATVFVAIVAVAFAACAKKATPDEIKKAYAKLVELQKAANPAPAVEDPAVKINAQFAQQNQALLAEQGEALKAIDAELTAAKEALPKAKKGKKGEAAYAEAVAKVEAEFKAKAEAKQGEFAPKFAELNKKKADALKAAADAKAKADADAKAQADKDAAAYLDKAVKDRTTKAKVDCQLKAAKLDDFNKCK